MNNDINQKINWNFILPILFLILGICLLIYMIIVEDEPGAVPLILICISLVLIARNWHNSNKQ